MSELDIVEGPNLRLRLVQDKDASYIFSLRTNPTYNIHLSEVTGTIEDQRLWIEAYKIREAEKTELYYMIELLDNTVCGTVRLYDIQENAFTWGSWILDHNKPKKAALESAVLSFGIGFGPLQCQVALIDVRTDNKRALNFYRRFGMQEVSNDSENVYFNYHRDRFLADRARHLAVVSEAAGG